MTRPVPLTILAFLAVLAVVVLVATGQPSETVQRYCEYGAVSDAQYEGCLDHVSEDEIAERDTPAARYARHELPGCDFVVSDDCFEYPYEVSSP